MDAEADNADWYEGLSEVEKAELDEADADIAVGRVSSLVDVMTRIEAWIKQ